jgi:predicted transcriptional regulator
MPAQPNSADADKSTIRTGLKHDGYYAPPMLDESRTLAYRKTSKFGEDFVMSAPVTLHTAAEVVAAYVSNNPVPKGELPALIQAVHDALARLSNQAEVPPAKEEPRESAVSLRKSITPEYLICLEDGKKFKSLKRHLAGHGLTPDQYRTKWKLPSDYPMVAPHYAAVRSTLAKAIGLGQMSGKARGRNRGRPPKAVQA